MRSGALLGFCSAMGSIFLAVACGSSGSLADDSGSSLVLGAGGSAGSVSLSAGGASTGHAGNGGTSSTGAGGGQSHGGGLAAGGAGAAFGGSGGIAAGGGGVCPPTQPGHTPVCAMSGSDDCASCVCGTPDCADKWNACAADDACARALTCVLASCATTLCSAIAGDGQTKLISLLGCLTGSCATSCNVGHAAGGAAGSGHGGGAGASSAGAAGSGHAGKGTGGGGGGQGTGGGQVGGAGGGSTGGIGGESGSGGGIGGGATTGGAGAAGAGGGPALTCESSSCDHDLCMNGGALGSACSTCAYAVCQKDNYCCDAQGFWDDLCVARAADLCGCACGAGGAGGTSGGGGSGGAAAMIACKAPTETPSLGACATVDPKGPVECNPITGAPCDMTSGAVCDASYVAGTLAGFHCYGGSNTQLLCAPCGLEDGFCSVGLTCTTQGCGKFCCDAADCGPNATCDKSLAGFEIGVCLGG